MNKMGIVRLVFVVSLLALPGLGWSDDEAVEEGLSVLVLGSGSPAATSSGRASAGYLIFTDGTPRVLMDVGGGTFQRLAASGVNIHALDLILLSHLHIDHTADLSAMIKTIYFHSSMAGVGRKAPIHIYGPVMNGVAFPNNPTPQYPSTSTYVDDHYAISHGSERYLNVFAGAISAGASAFSYQVHNLDSKVADARIQTVLDSPDGLSIKAIAVDHGPVPALAFRIEYKGKTLVYSGDTASTGPNMITLAKGADALIYDTAITDTLPRNPLFHVLHTSPTRMGEVAAAAQVKHLVFSHITPVTETRLEEVKRVVRAQAYRGKISVAKDLKVYNLAEDD